MLFFRKECAKDRPDVTHQHVLCPAFHKNWGLKTTYSYSFAKLQQSESDQSQTVSIHAFWIQWTATSLLKKK